MLLTLLFHVVSGGNAAKICPAHCLCDDVKLHATCKRANLDTLPILLNPEVRNINLSQNKIGMIDFALVNYRHLVSLDLSFNRIQKLGSENFLSQINLKYLNLSNNDIGNLTKDSLIGLKALDELDLSYNNLKILHEHVFRELFSLKILKLSNNQLEHLEQGLFKHSKLLQVLHLDNNQLLYIPVSAFADAINLQYLSFSNNLIGDLEENQMPNLPVLRTLLLDGNSINDVHAGALSGVIALNHLDLSDNNFTSVPTASLSKLSNLVKLKLRGNFIISIPPVAFRGLFHLRFLHLDGLEVLETIDVRAFVDNIYLERVWLDNNIKMKKLPTTLFHGNKHLTHISIRNNRLTTLEAAHFPLDQLKVLRLSENPFICNCSLMWLWRLAQEQKKINENQDQDQIQNQNNTADENHKGLFIDTDGIECAGPEGLEGTLLEETTELQMGCSISLIATISAVVFGVVILSAILIVLYFGPIRRRFNAKNEEAEKPELEIDSMPNYPANGNGTMRNNMHHMAYNEPRQIPMNKYIIGPPIVREYPVISSCRYEKYRQENDPVSMDMYRDHYDVTPKATRPHIVYV